MKKFLLAFLVILMAGCDSNIALVNVMENESEILLERQVDGKLTIDTVDHYQSSEDKAFIDAYQKILAEFDNNRHYYKAITAQEWIEIANAIISIDETVDKGVGWGNLVLKFTFADFLMRTYITLPLKQLPSDELAELLSVQKRVRYVIYPRLKSARFAISFYSDEPLPFSNWRLEKTVGNDLNEKGKGTIRLGEKLFPEEKLKEILRKEKTNLRYFSGSYKQLYLNPAPMSFIFAPRYLEGFWELNFCTEKAYRLKTKARDQSDKEVLDKLIEEQFKPENIKWLPYDLEYSKSRLREDLSEVLEHCDKR